VPAVTRYRDAVDVKRAARLYDQGWTLRQIGAELGVSRTTVGHQLRRAGLTMRRGGPPAHPASTQQILELRDQGLTWSEVAEQVDMTVSGAWSRYRRARPPRSPRLVRWQQVLADALTRTLRLGSERPLLIISVEPHPGRAECRTTSSPESRCAGSCPRASRAGRRCGRQCGGSHLSGAG
jgi:hypothetical protein